MEEALPALYAAGRFLAAWEALGSRTDVLHAGRGAGRLLHARLANQLGAPRLALQLELRAWREEPGHAECAAYRLRLLQRLRGPVEAWELVQERGGPGAGPGEAVADWHCALAQLLIQLRDLDAAGRELAAAAEAAPDFAWVFTNRAWLAESAGRREEALALARAGLERQAWHRPSLHGAVRLLVELGREAEALALAAAGEAATESAELSALLAWLLERSGDPHGALAALERFAVRSPLLEPDGGRWLASRRSELLARVGDDAGAIAEGRRGHPFHRAAAERMAAAGPAARRVEIPLAWERQDWNTCGPATLTMLARHQGLALSQADLVAAIWYEGTSDQRERAWAEGAGFLVREATLTAAAARALIDAGLPFALVTRHALGGHLQAVSGYDERRGMLLVQDPGRHWTVEMVLDPLLAQQAPWGPRILVLARGAAADRLAALDLPDAAARDRLHRLRTALEEGRRDAAAAELAALRAEAPQHVLALHAERELAWHDGDARAAQRCLRELLRRFPACPDLVLAQLDELRAGESRAVRLEHLRRALASPEADPVLRRAQAVELAEDPREARQAERVLRAYLRLAPSDGLAWRILGNLAWERGASAEEGRARRALALAAYRFAACLLPADGRCAAAYARALRWDGRPEAGEAWLKARRERLGAQAAEPHLTWADWLEESGLPDQALEQLAGAAAGLEGAERTAAALALATRLAAAGRIEEARVRLAEARPGAGRLAWLRAAAQVEEAAGMRTEALACWRELLAVGPLAGEAHAAVVRLLDALEGPEAARAHLASAVARHPHAVHQAVQRIELLKAQGLEEERARAARHLVTVHPGDTWGWRELGFACLELRREEEAAEACAEAVAREPGHPGTLHLQAQLARRRGEAEAARAALRRAIALEADDDWAIRHLLALAPDQAAARGDLALVAAALRSQTLSGAGLQAWSEAAAIHLPPEEVLAVLREAQAARPDLPAAWSHLVQGLLRHGQVEEAVAVARGAVARFPALARTAADLAEALVAAGDREAAIAAWRQAAGLDRRWHWPRRELAQCLTDLGRGAEAEAELAALCAEAPRDAWNQGCLAAQLLATGRRAEALDRLERAVRLEPAYDWAWGHLAAEDPARTLAAARACVAERPGAAEGWLRLARALARTGDAEGRLDAARRASALAPQREDARAAFAWALEALGRGAEALAVCAAAPGGATPGLRLLQARLQRETGDQGGAEAQLRALLADHPGQREARLELCELLRSLGRIEEARTEGRELVRRFPRDEVAHAHLGEAELIGKDAAAARASFATAFALAPGYAFAGIQLARLCLAAGDLAAAAQAQAALDRLPPEPESESLAARLLARQGRGAAAVERFLRLAAMAEAEDRAVEEAHAALRQAGVDGTAVGRLDDLVESAPLAPAAARLWASHGMRLRPARQDAQRLCAVLAALGEGAEAAAVAWIDVRAEARELGRLAALIAAAPPRLQASARLWGEMGYALLACDDLDGVLLWLDGWHGRSGLQPWMLTNLATALRRRRREAEAAAVIAAARSLPADHCEAHVRCWWAADQALAGAGAEAREELRPWLGRELPDYERDLRDLAAAACHAATGKPRQAWHGLAAYRDRLAGGNRQETPEFRRLRLAVAACAYRADTGLLRWFRRLRQQLV